jgi:hypothetical protein
VTSIQKTTVTRNTLSSTVLETGSTSVKNVLQTKTTQRSGQKSDSSVSTNIKLRSVQKSTIVKKLPTVKTGEILWLKGMVRNRLSLLQQFSEVCTNFSQPRTADVHWTVRRRVTTCDHNESRTSVRLTSGVRRLSMSIKVLCWFESKLQQLWRCSSRTMRTQVSTVFTCELVYKCTLRRCR